MRGALSWLSGVMDNAIYPVLFVDYCATLDADLALPLPRAVSKRERKWVGVWLLGAFFSLAQTKASSSSCLSLSPLFLSAPLLYSY